MSKQRNINIGLLVLLLLVAAISVPFIIMYQADKSMAKGGIHIDTAYHLPAKEKLSMLDSLPYYQYKQIEDSIKKRAVSEKEKNILHPWGILGGIGIKLSFVGVIPAFRTWYGWYGDNKSHLEIEHFISLSGYTITEGLEAFQKNGNYYLKTKDGKEKEIGVAFLPYYHAVLIPISNRTYNIGLVLMLIILGIFYFALLYIILALPVNVLLNIARGKVFTEQNIRDLYMIAFTLLGFFLSGMILPMILRLFVTGWVPNDFSISFRTLFSDFWDMGLSGLIALAIAKAFSKGYQLQLEQDLTV